MPKIITQRDEDGTWFAQSLIDDRVSCWCDCKADARVFDDEEQAVGIARATSAYQMTNPTDTIRGPVRVMEV